MFLNNTLSEFGSLEGNDLTKKHQTGGKFYRLKILKNKYYQKTPTKTFLAFSLRC